VCATTAHNGEERRGASTRIGFAQYHVTATDVWLQEHLEDDQKLSDRTTPPLIATTPARFNHMLKP